MRRDHMLPKRRPKGATAYAGRGCEKCGRQAIRRLYGRAFEHGVAAAHAKIEATRVEGILRACRAARISQSFADRLIADRVPLQTAQVEILRELEGRSARG